MLKNKNSQDSLLALQKMHFRYKGDHMNETTVAQKDLYTYVSDRTVASSIPLHTVKTH